jgi:hypothetical protein
MKDIVKNDVINEILGKIGANGEVILYSPTSINQIVILHPETSLGVQMIAATKMANEDWLVYLKTDNELIFSVGSQLGRCPGDIVDDSWNEIPVKYRLKKHPYENPFFWEKIFEEIKLGLEWLANNPQ